ncbi:hypothetical protein [Nocardia africana]|uniref:Uncharacterized protein n=1 Tax=Nocardia africana TaxID=134964 RepID=A0A378X1B7_9NOCA|nr:hypothetical protein [Nocardia africana]MCC3311498.1 hypothetical protein [Nocardia africana]SUA47239.1 Uncharacterised protein [Nocardia africana]
MPDRYGDETAEPCCRNGWLSLENADVQKPCPIHRPPRTDSSTDYDPTRLSDRARAAIEKADNDDHAY